MFLPSQVFLEGQGGGGGGAVGSPPKEEGALRKWLHGLADALKRLPGKAVEALPASVVGAIFKFPWERQ